MKEGDFKVKSKLCKIYGNLDDIDFECIYSLPRNILKDNKVIELQYKILFRYIPTNKLLYKMKKTPSPNCSFCQMLEESIEHLFYNCNNTRNFWLNILQKWNTALDTDIVVALKDVILGYQIFDNVLSDVEKALNIVIMYGKRYIFQCKVSSQELSTALFFQNIKLAMLICKYPENSVNYIKCLYEE